jgi:uncharacterized OB-fold protein
MGKEECEHEYELLRSAYSYDPDTGKVYKILKKKCKKCGKVRNFKQYDLNVD